MEVISLKQIYGLLAEVCSELNRNKIDYLVYGSVAMNLLTDQENKVNDIDIMVKEADFEKIKHVLPETLNPIQTQYSIHANSKQYLGHDNKPFDISFDSYEHYFQKDGIDLTDFARVQFEEQVIQVIPQESLRVIYQKYSK